MTDRNLLGLLSLEPLQQGADFLKFSDLLLPAFLKLGLLGCVTANQLLDLLALALIRVHKQENQHIPSSLFKNRGSDSDHAQSLDFGRLLLHLSLETLNFLQGGLFRIAALSPLLRELAFQGANFSLSFLGVTPATKSAA